eukprot:1662829-Pyramimonas_sp.AAC.1
MSRPILWGTGTRARALGCRGTELPRVPVAFRRFPGASAAGYAIEESRPLRGLSGGTLAHRLYHCQSEVAATLGVEVPPAELFAKGAENAEHSLVLLL